MDGLRAFFRIRGGLSPGTGRRRAVLWASAVAGGILRRRSVLRSCRRDSSSGPLRPKNAAPPVAEAIDQCRRVRRLHQRSPISAASGTSADCRSRRPPSSRRR